jgi:hypothetical protein
MTCADLLSSVVMELGFMLEKGPLSQISVPLSAMDSAVQLAVGAYGWWKARERTLSLAQLLKSKKAAISSPMTFNQTVYARKREEGSVRGAAVQNGVLSMLSLPNASTAIDSGMICLRALVAALLCFFGENAVTQILVDVVPRTMIHYELEGEEVVVEGPLITAFNQYVKAVAVEEDSDTLRTKLLDSVNVHQARITGASLSDILKSDTVYFVDSHLMVGLVRWALTSRKTHYWYPTRSLHVWALGLVLSQLGFEVDVEYHVASSEDDYNLLFGRRNHFGGHPKVVLVPAPVGETDHCAPVSTASSISSLYAKPQLLPIHAIPMVLFRHLTTRRSDQSSAQRFSDIWQYTYDDVSRAITSGPRLHSGGLMEIQTSPGRDVTLDEHRRLVSIWSLQLNGVLGTVMTRWFPNVIIAEAVIEYANNLRCKRIRGTLWDNSEIKDMWHVMVAIILAAVFAIGAKGLRVHGLPLNSDAEIAISRDLLYDKKLYDWANIAGLALIGGVTPAQWTGFLLELSTGGTHKQPLGEVETDLSISGNSYHLPSIGNLNEQSLRVSDVMGMQANGIVVICDLIVRASISNASILLHHLQYGQLINYPLDDDGYIRASLARGPSSPIALNTGHETSVLNAGKSGITIRIDVEPDWENDPRTVVFRARLNGVCFASFSPHIVASRLQSRKREFCFCKGYTSSIEVAVSERWQIVNTAQLARGSGRRVSLASGDRIFVPAAGDEALTLLCLGWLDCDSVVVARDCLKCAHNGLKAMLNKKGSTAAIVSLVQEK